MRNSVPIKICGTVLALAAVSAFGSDDPMLTMACGVVLTLTIGLLWRLGEPPILLLPAGIQVIQVVMPRLYANFLGVSMQDISLAGLSETRLQRLGLRLLQCSVLWSGCGAVSGEMSASAACPASGSTALGPCGGHLYSAL